MSNKLSLTNVNRLILRQLNSVTFDKKYNTDRGDYYYFTPVVIVKRHCYFYTTKLFHASPQDIHNSENIDQRRQKRE